MDISPELVTEVERQVLAARAAARTLRTTTGEKRAAALDAIAKAILAAKDEILAANEADLAAAKQRGTRGALLDRLLLDEARLKAIADGVWEVAGLPDPLGRFEEETERPNGLRVARMRIPLGVIAMIYEARPNVTVDAAALCIRSGNAVVLRGGSEAIESNRALAKAIGAGLYQVGLPRSAVTLLAETDRDAILALLRLTGLVDLAIPRGGEGLIRFVVENARVPVIQHFKGVCHVYVDAAADLEKARAIVLNSKTQRPGVCNAAETLLVHEEIAEAFLPGMADALMEAGVELRCDDRALEILGGPDSPDKVTVAEKEDWDAEFLDLVLAVRVVPDLDTALDHIDAHGSFHTEAIVTEDEEAQGRWLSEVDASCVIVNASTRFNDGGELGLGVEMGISTTKMHAYGPMGLQELTARKFVVLGEGQIRG
ncbi:MAG: glutamate-5-semialdehyde dehydrogenase [Deltaproteobacteria bacterium]|nr:glutamate-5-semialdehyde dehydrogenase [Deltaproteobacteria bacterium]